jgi:hypothetical protein
MIESVVLLSMFTVILVAIRLYAGPPAAPYEEEEFDGR